MSEKSSPDEWTVIEAPLHDGGIQCTVAFVRAGKVIQNGPVFSAFQAAQLDAARADAARTARDRNAALTGERRAFVGMPPRPSPLDTRDTASTQSTPSSGSKLIEPLPRVPRTTSG